MKYILGIDRKQTSLFPISLDDTVEDDNSVRAIDQFVESLDLKSMGFRLDFIENGRPAYHPKVLLKLYIYGYMNYSTPVFFDTLLISYLRRIYESNSTKIQYKFQD